MALVHQFGIGTHPFFNFLLYNNYIKLGPICQAKKLGSKIIYCAGGCGARLRNWEISSIWKRWVLLALLLIFGIFGRNCQWKATGKKFPHGAPYIVKIGFGARLKIPLH
jgi:hypothetical protein